MRGQAQPGNLPVRLPVRANQLPKPRLRLVGKPVFPSEVEIASNPRSRSAVMRVAERTAA
jgi:16S rRNA (cytosine1402-N4)-methyltransferase